MRLGIPRGYFYYDYMNFFRTLFQDSGIELVLGRENCESIFEKGNRTTVNEACYPIKLMAGQTEALAEECDMILIPRIMKEITGRWLCPKLLGINELLIDVSCREKLLVTEPVYLNNRTASKRAFRSVYRTLGGNMKKFRTSFERAYCDELMRNIGLKKPHIEADWEFVPQPPKEGEIVLPNLKQVLLTGHSYMVYDAFANGHIIKKLDNHCIGTLTEKDVSRPEREKAIERLNLEKKPYWESFVKTVGTALALQKRVDGIIYLSSFSCGTDSFNIEILKNHLEGCPLLVLKIDEHKGSAGYDTRIEAFADLLERSRVS